MLSKSEWWDPKDFSGYWLGPATPNQDVSVENKQLRAKVRELEEELKRRSSIGHGCDCWVCRAKGEKRG